MRLTRDDLDALTWAVDQAGDWRGVYTGNPDKIDLAAHDRSMLAAIMALGKVDRLRKAAEAAIDVSPYEDFKIDEPVMVRDSDDSSWCRRHFAGVDSDGDALTWANCGTSFTRTSKTQWEQCRRPTPEELDRSEV